MSTFFSKFFYSLMFDVIDGIGTTVFFGDDNRERGDWGEGWNERPWRSLS